MRTVRFATSPEHLSLYPDDRLAAAALERRGVRVEPLVWSAPGPGARPGELVVVRSCWDYHLRPAEFSAWLDALERARAPVVNPPPLLRWNLHKRYLLELERRGVAIVPTALAERGGRGSLADLLEARGWEEAVVKPAVSLSAHETRRVARAGAAEHEARFAALRARGDLLVQPFLPEIASAGEWSLVFLGGAYSHAVRKRPRPGDFRVQSDYGGSAAPGEPAPEVLRAARLAVQALPLEPAYARVDGVETAGGFLLMELECIDPVLFLAHRPEAAERFARVLLERLPALPSPLA